ncbi:hypothetical protein [Micromonospora sp. NBC_01796]|uniref:hypothetical protein n=1 Tax=Micromonospora sp. NBC_01796 TaxID=2975987 RepID=UPI002DD90DE8|nr:hypothetical protein [Micromonospora sp. NBC_01796]WSA88895.1 hypothetical protein OIE47_15510 [Micromonospora sp. NBC_01796]
MSTQVPRLFAGLVDDAAVFPPGSASLDDAVIAHRAHRTAWYADLVGPLLVPASALVHLPALLSPDERIEVGVITDVPIHRLSGLLAAADPRLVPRQLEAAVAKRGEDPLPGLTELLALGTNLPTMDLYAEVPLTWGLLAALDRIARARADGVRIAAKFRTGGLAAELFPSPVELAAVIRACRDRDLPFKLTAGLHHALRHTDPETGFTHHGFVNVLVATLAAAEDAEVAEIAELLASSDPLRLVEPARIRRDRSRPLWRGFGSCSIDEPLTDLARLGLMNQGETE